MRYVIAMATVVPLMTATLSRAAPSRLEKVRRSSVYSSEAEYLLPSKKTLPDIFVSKEQLPRALGARLRKPSRV